MRAAMTQMNLIWENREANLKKGEALVKRAGEEGAELVIFPEMSFTGFSMKLDITAEEVLYWRKLQDGEVPVTYSAQRVLEWSLAYDIAVVFGYAVKRQGRGVNCLLAADRGRVCAYYEKIHPFTYGEEGKYFTGGSRLCKCTLGDISFGMFICYDLRFPEIFQAVSKDCTAAVVIANWPKERLEHWRVLLQARAIENQSYLLGVNRIGQGGGLTYAESSICFDPYGRQVPGYRVTMGGKQEGAESAESLLEDSLVLVELDARIAEEYRRGFPLKQDRREELYKSLR